MGTMKRFGWMAVVVGLSFAQYGGCDAGQDPATGTEFEIAVTAKPSLSYRMDPANPYWHEEATSIFTSDLRLPDGGHLDLGHQQVNGYDFMVNVLPAHHTSMWDGGMSMWMEMEPLGTHYIAVKLGSSAGTNNTPHEHLRWVEPPGHPTDEEEEEAEEAYFAMRLVPTYANVKITMDGTPYGGELELSNYVLKGVETNEGMRYAENVGRASTDAGAATGMAGAVSGIPDGTYDITVTVDVPKVSRMEDAKDEWSMMPLTFTFTGVTISSGTAEVSGKPRRSLACGAAAYFTVLDDFDGDPEADHDGDNVPDGEHTHDAYRENSKGDVNQNLTSGLNTMVCQLRAQGVRNIYDRRGNLTSPWPADDIHLWVSLWDPKGMLDHHDTNLWELPNAGAEVVITNRVTGATLTIHEDDLVPMYSHELGFHYGASFRPPWQGTGGGTETGGHTH
ncbi:MAG: hypothetical protein HY716_06750 [Planctomycetes bacterium]|nr:hypothetical protein [Planctomycetota bacterium]